MSLNLFPARVPIGKFIDADGRTQDVLASAEFVRALASLLQRVGGTESTDLGALDLLASFSSAPDQANLSAVRDTSLANVFCNAPTIAPVQFDDQSINYASTISELSKQLADLRVKVDSIPDMTAAVSKVRSYANDIEISYSFAPPQTDWEHPGSIGLKKANAGAFAALTATTFNGNTWTAGTGTLTIVAGKTGTINNSITFTATDGSTLAIGTGGTLGTAAYTASSSYQAVSSIGSWTPTDASGAALAFTTASGRYFTIGKLVFLSARVTYPATADASAAAIGNLPFTCGSAGNPQYNAAGEVIGGGTANKIGPDRGTIIGYLYTTGNTAATNVGQSGQILDFSVIYLMA